MQKKVLVTGNIPRQVVESLEKFFTVSVHTEDKPMERQTDRCCPGCKRAHVHDHR